METVLQPLGDVGSEKNLAHDYARRYHEARVELGATAEYHRLLNRELMAFLPEDPESVVLDDMCGSGIILGDLKEKYRTVVGLDFSSAMLSFARDASPEVLVGDAHRLPFGEGSFDAIVSRGGFHEVADLDRAFREAGRVLKPGGVLLIFEPYDEFLIPRWVRKLVYQRSEAFDPESERGLRSDELARLAAESGLNIDRLDPFGSIAYTLFCNSDVFAQTRWLSRIPGARRVVGALFGLDRILSDLPLVERLSLLVVGRFVKKVP